MDLIRQQHTAAAVADVVGLTGAGRSIEAGAAEIQPQLRVRVGGGGRSHILPEPVQHLLGGEGAGREAEDPGELFLELRPFRLRRLQVCHEVPNYE